MPVGHVVVPQRAYTAVHQPRVDPLWIPFTCGGVSGVNIGLAARGLLITLDDPDERSIYEGMGKKVTYRIEVNLPTYGATSTLLMTSQWPGYKPFKFTKNIKGASGFVTRATIATQVAEAFKAFINVSCR